MYDSLEKYSIIKLTIEKRENLNRPIVIVWNLLQDNMKGEKDSGTEYR